MATHTISSVAPLVSVDPLVPPFTPNAAPVCAISPNAAALAIRGANSPTPRAPSISRRDGTHSEPDFSKVFRILKRPRDTDYFVIWSRLYRFDEPHHRRPPKSIMPAVATLVSPAGRRSSASAFTVCGLAFRLSAESPPVPAAAAFR